MISSFLHDPQPLSSTTTSTTHPPPHLHPPTHHRYRTPSMTPADLQARLQGLVRQALEAEETKMATDGDHDHALASTRRLAAAVRHAETTLRAGILAQQYDDPAQDEQAKDALLAALRGALEPFQSSLRACLRAVYEADAALSQTLQHGTTELARMEQARDRPVEVLEALRFAHRMRPVTSAPPGWQPGVTLGFLPPNPFMPVNECIAASQLRTHHLQVLKANRERRKRRQQEQQQQKGGGGGEGDAPALDATDAATMELIRQLSESGSLGAPPPGWQPGQSLSLDANVLKRLKSEVSGSQAAVAKQPALGGGGGGGGGGGRGAPPAKPKKQTFMDSSSDEEEEDED